MARLVYVVTLAIGMLTLLLAPAHANIGAAKDSVVSVLPDRPGKPRGGEGARPGVAPEATGVVVGPNGLIATALHAVAAARRIDVRLADGRILPAQFVGRDKPSDIALLRVNTKIPQFSFAPEPSLAQPVCAIANAYGLGLSVACGVVSAVGVSNARFNAVEDFIQTDAAVNPGSSGGALVDADGRLVGMISAIFAAKADTNIGINFAVSARLLQRVVSALAADGQVEYFAPGWRLARLSRRELATTVGVRVAKVSAQGAAAAAGLKSPDIVTRIGDSRIRTPRDAVAALALVRPGESVEVDFVRAGRKRTATLSYGTAAEVDTAPEAQTAATPDCPHPRQVCDVRQAVFPIESRDPLASAVRIGDDLLVTNRHAIGARRDATVNTPNGQRQARVIASAYRGDLALLQVDGLPPNGLVLAPTPVDANPADGRYFVVGADIVKKQIRVFKPGRLLSEPAEGAPLGRIHVAAQMQPGVSGGALVDGDGRLVGIAVGGGEGRNEALPIGGIKALLDGRKGAAAEESQKVLGEALEACEAALDKTQRLRRGQRPEPATLSALTSSCSASENPSLLLRAGRQLAFARAFDDAIRLTNAAVQQTPNSINARISLLVSLQLAGRFAQMLPHAKWLMEALPNDPQALRFSIQSGVWGGEPQLAEAAYQKLLKVDPRQAQAARRFIDRPPRTPPRR